MQQVCTLRDEDQKRSAAERSEEHARRGMRPLHYPENVGDRWDWGVCRTSGRAGVTKSRVPSTEWGVSRAIRSLASS